MQWYLESRQLAASGSLVLLLGYDYSYCWVDWRLFDGVVVEYSRLLVSVGCVFHITDITAWLLPFPNATSMSGTNIIILFRIFIGM